MLNPRLPGQWPYPSESLEPVPVGSVDLLARCDLSPDIVEQMESN
jgi:hypothetical protein